MTWSRRQLLQLFAAGALAPSVAPLLQACGGSQSYKTPFRGQTQRSLDEINDQVRAAVARLAKNFREASAFVVRRNHGNAVVDETEKHVDTGTTTSLVFRAASDAGWFERATTDLSSAGINIAELQLRQRSAAPLAPAGPPTRPLAVTTVQHTTAMKLDPRSLTPQDWLARLTSLFDRARLAGDSRIVYRGAYLLLDDTESLFVTPTGEVTQRLVHTRTGVQFIAWTGSRPSIDEASRAGTMGLEAMRIATAELNGAARRAMSLLTARGARNFDNDVVLDPSVVALIAQHCIGPALDGDRWARGDSTSAAGVGKRLGSNQVSVIDDPSRPGLYGSYFIDDEGRKATPSVLIDKGVIKAPLTDRASAARLKVAPTGNGRRANALAPAHPHFSNLWFAPGSRSRDELIESVDDGVLVEGGVRAQFDPRSGRVIVRASRALEIRQGRLTGKLYANIDLISDLSSLLSSVRGMSTGVVHRVASGGLPATAGGPYMLTRAKLVGRG